VKQDLERQRTQKRDRTEFAAMALVQTVLSITSAEIGFMEGVVVCQGSYILWVVFQVRGGLMGSCSETVALKEILISSLDELDA